MLENKNFAAVSAKSAATVDEGLRQYMIKVYNYMAAGLCLTAFAAYLVANTSLIRLFSTLPRRAPACPVWAGCFCWRRF